MNSFFNWLESKDKELFEVYKNSGLGKWFGEKWVDISRKKDGKHPECGGSAERKNKQKGYPKCRPAKEASAMSDEEKERASEQKRRVEREESDSGKGRKPNMVSHKEWSEISEENKPTNPELWEKAKAAARSKFDVYPSAYANAWAAKYYKSKGGGWKKS